MQERVNEYKDGLQSGNSLGNEMVLEVFLGLLLLDAQLFGSLLARGGPHAVVIIGLFRLYDGSQLQLESTFFFPRLEPCANDSIVSIHLEPDVFCGGKRCFWRLISALHVLEKPLC